MRNSCPSRAGSHESHALPGTVLLHAPYCMAEGTRQHYVTETVEADVITTRLQGTITQFSFDPNSLLLLKSNIMPFFSGAGKALADVVPGLGKVSVT